MITFVSIVLYWFSVLAGVNYALSPVGTREETLNLLACALLLGIATGLQIWGAQ